MRLSPIGVAVPEAEDLSPEFASPLRRRYIADELPLQPVRLLAPQFVSDECLDKLSALPTSSVLSRQIEGAGRASLIPNRSQIIRSLSTGEGAHGPDSYLEGW